MNRTRALRYAVLSVSVVASCLHGVHTAAAEGERATFGESAMPELPTVGGGGGGDLIGVDDSSGAPTATIPFELLRARGGVQPGLGLHYVPYVDGDAGRGWTLGMPVIERKPLTGLPDYKYDPTPTFWPFPDKTDRIVFSGAALVPLCTVTSGSCTATPSEHFASSLEGWHYFRRLVDTDFRRFFWSPDLRTWRVEDPSGAVLEFGVPRNDTSYMAATDVESAPCQDLVECPLTYRPPFRWNLVREWDARGELANPIAYRWASYPLPSGEQTRGYLTDIFDTPPASDRIPPSDFSVWAHHARLEYEAQPFLILSGTSEIYRWHDERLKRVVITSKDFDATAPRSEVRLYVLTYADATGGVPSRVNSSYLATVTPYAMAPKGACVEDATYSIPQSCAARALPAQSIYYDGINAQGSAHQCEASAFRGQATTVFSGLSTSDLENYPLAEGTLTATGGDGLSTYYLPTQSGSGPFALGNAVPGSGSLSFKHVTVDAKYYFGYIGGNVNPADILARSRFNVVGDWGFDGANLLFGVSSTPQDIYGEMNQAPGFMILRTAQPQPDLQWTEVMEQSSVSSCGYYANCQSAIGAACINGTCGCNTNSDCTTGICDTGAHECGCNADSDCPANLTCTNHRCGLGTGILFGDLNADGLVDELGATDPAVNGGARISRRDPIRGRVVPFLNLIPNSWGAPLPTEAAGVSLTDVNGDGLADYIQSSLCQKDANDGNQLDCTVIYYPGDGRGGFGQYATTDIAQIHWPNAPEIAFSGLHDVNGDGLPDLIVSDGPTSAVIFNADGQHWIAPSATDMTSNALGTHRLTRLVYGDVDGDGMDDVLAVSDGDLSGGSTFDEDPITYLAAPRCGRLAQVVNGYGAVATLHYDRLARLEQAGLSQGTSPIPIEVVAGVDMTVPGGQPSQWATSYFYDKPHYDHWTRQLRGFEFVRKRVGLNESFADVTTGNPNALHHTQTVTHYRIDGCTLVGVNHVTEMDGTPSSCNPDKDLLRQLPALPIQVDELGDASRAADLSNPFPYTAPPGSSYRSTTTMSYELPAFATGLDGRVVQQVLRDEVNTYLYDDAPFVTAPQTITQPTFCTTSPNGDRTCTNSPITVQSDPAHYARLRRTTAYDAVGNVKSDTDYGHVDDNGAPIDPLDPPVEVDFTPIQVGQDWTWRRQDMTLRGRGTVGQATDADRHYHFDWYSSGELWHVYGDLSGTLPLDRFHEGGLQVAPAPTNASADGPNKLLATFGIDAHGNVTQVQGPNNRCTQYAYDEAFAQLPTATTTFTAPLPAPACSGSALLTQTSYVREFAAPASTISPSGAVSTVAYDDRGRVKDLSQPDPALIGMTVATADIGYHDDPQGPYHYTHILTTGGRQSYVYFDALDRAVFRFENADTAAGDLAPWIISGARSYDDDQDILSYEPMFFAGDPSTVSVPPVVSAGYTTIANDEYFRPLVAKALDGTQIGSSAYHALSVDSYSEGNVKRTATRNGHGLMASTSVALTSRSDTLILSYLYTASGDVAQVQQTHASNASDVVTRWLQRDTFGRVVANHEPNATITDGAGTHFWRYAYDDSGDIVGNSDARGCGENVSFDGSGRIYAEDYSPCLNSQQPYSPPDSQNYNGTEAYYQYDADGRLTAAFDRGAEDVYRYDARDRATRLRRMVARPGQTAYNIVDRYASRVQEIDLGYDDLNRVVSKSTGADVPELQGAGGATNVYFNYSLRGVIKSVTSDYDAGTPLLSAFVYDADGFLRHTQYGDHANTEVDVQPDARRRVQSITRARGSNWWTNTNTYAAPSTNPPTTLQTVLEASTFGYDPDGNLKTVQDGRISAEWPPGAQPVTRDTKYDEARRVTRETYTYPSSSDPQTPVFTSSEVSALPALQTPTRIRQESLAYDWRGNVVNDVDDRSVFFDRSLGKVIPDAVGPHRVATAQGKGGTLQAKYDGAGNLTTLVLDRLGTCLGPIGKCYQLFVYDWDEVGQLSRARRWDYGSPPTYPPIPTTTPDIDLSFAYHQNQRIIKAATSGNGGTTYTVDVFPSLRLDGADWDAQGLSYVATPSNETVSLAGSARVVYDSSLPSRDGNAQHVLYEATDQVGSTTAVFDRNTGELVEYASNQTYGATESDYRPDRWLNYRAPERLSGNIDDKEVGLVYFGARYYSPNLKQWISADPLTIHALGSTFNPYSYLGGSPFQAVDVFGLAMEGGAGPWGVIGDAISAVGRAVGAVICNLVGCGGSSSASAPVRSGPPPAPPPPLPTPPSAAPMPPWSTIGWSLASTYTRAQATNIVGTLSTTIKLFPSGSVELSAADWMIDAVQRSAPSNSAAQSMAEVRNFVASSAHPGPDAPPLVSMVDKKNTVTGIGGTVALSMMGDPAAASAGDLAGTASEGTTALYHGTTGASAARILANGFRAGDIFFAEDMATAQHFAQEAAAARGATNPVVMRFEVPNSLVDQMARGVIGEASGVRFVDIPGSNGMERIMTDETINLFNQSMRSGGIPVLRLRIYGF